jgi:hypothetical protein
MDKKGKALHGLTPLHVPVPPMLAKAIGYTERARFVSFQWTPYGDEAEYSDGRMSATGNWQAFLAYIQHPAVSPSLDAYDLGSSETEANHALILDQAILEMFIVPVKEAEKFLIRQWPPVPPTHMIQEESVPKISIAVKHGKQPRYVDVEEIQRRIKEQFALIEAMQQWLDKQLKN